MIAEGKSEATIVKNRWLLEDLSSPLTKRPITQITSHEVLQLLQRYEKLGRRETAHRLRGTIGSVFRLTIRTQRAENDPTSALKGALLKVTVTNRAAITDEEQLGALMASIHEYDGWPTLRSAMLLLALTMVRPGEVRHLKKPEIDRKKAI
jgi:integrase